MPISTHAYISIFDITYCFRFQIIFFEQTNMSKTPREWEDVTDVFLLLACHKWFVI